MLFKKKQDKLQTSFESITHNSFLKFEIETF